MSTKTFNVVIPKQVAGHPDAMLSWIITHLNPGVPVNKTAATSDFQEIFNKLSLKLERTLAEENITSYRLVNGIPAATPEEYEIWKKAQSLELNITFEEDGRFRAIFQLCGPAHTPKEGEVGFGYLDLYQFGIGLYYTVSNDTYHMVLRDIYVEPLIIPTEGVKPIKLFPVFTFNYEQTRNDSKPPLTTHGLIHKFRESFSEVLWDTPSKLLNEAASNDSTDDYGSMYGIGYHGYENINRVIEVLEQQMLTADAFAGNFFEPLLLSAFSIEVPTSDGVLIYTKATFSYGQRMAVMLPVLFRQNTEKYIVTYS